MSVQIDKNSGFHLVYYFPTSLIVSLKYHHFTNKPANHCCQSLTLPALYWLSEMYNVCFSVSQYWVISLGVMLVHTR